MNEDHNDHQEEDEDENMEKGSQQTGSGITGYKRKLSDREHGKEEQSKSLDEMHHKQNEPQITSKKSSTKHKAKKSSILSIVRYVDYTQKYGSGYVLTNG